MKLILSLLVPILLIGQGVVVVPGGGGSVPGGGGGANPSTSVYLTRATDQAGTDRYCRSTTGNATYTCSVTPTLTTYGSGGGCLVLNANFTNVTTATVNVNGLGTKSILNRAGTSLVAGDITADKPVTVCYDGTQYIIQGDGNSPNTVYAHTQSGADWGAKINNAIALLDSRGGVIDATGITGYNDSTTPVVINREYVEIRFGFATLAYCGTGDAISMTTDSSGSPKARFINLVGMGVYSTLIVTKVGCASTADSIVHTKWATHVKMRDMAIVAYGPATRVVWEEQSLEIALQNMVLWNGGSGSGTRAWYMSGPAYGHHRGVNAVGGEYNLLVEPNTTVIPTAVRTGLGYITGDGNNASYNSWTDLQGHVAGKTGIVFQCNGTDVFVNQNNFNGVRTIGAGISAVDDDNENGFNMSCPTVTGSEAIFDNLISGFVSSYDNQHGIMLYGNVIDNQFLGVSVRGNGATGANPAYGVYLRDGTGVYPAGNTIKGASNPSTAIAANRSFVTSTNSVRNRLEIATSGSYTLNNNTDYITIQGAAAYSSVLPSGTLTVPSGAVIATTGTGLISATMSFIGTPSSGCSSSASPAVCGTNISGSFVVAAGATSVVVNTTAITANTQIIVGYDSSLGTRLGVTCNTTPVVPLPVARTAGTSFTIGVLSAPVTNPACFSYILIN